VSSLLKNVEGLFKGLLVEYTPGIVRGALVQLMASVTVKSVAEWVEKDYVLLEKVPDKYRKELYALKLGKLEWLTTDWVIQALKDDKPQIASLFLSWDKGREWLDRQCEIIKKELSSGPK